MTSTTIKRANGQINIVLNQEIRAEKPTVLDEKILSKHYPLERIQKELQALVGMKEVKRLINEIYAWIYINQCRKKVGLKQEKQALHMLFKGNPGTGKTTVARLLAKLFHDMDVLSKGHLIEVERADLVGEYIGHTAQKTRELLKKAHGGILFIDEAYSLARGGEKDFGKEAIDTLVKAMEDNQHELILILAGYPKEMDYFLSLNPGMPSRFPIIMNFEDYSNDELIKIARSMARERDYMMSTEAELKIKHHLERYRAANKNSFSNARYVRNIIEKSIRKQAVRLLKGEQFDRHQLMTLLAVDIQLEDDA
ncbi:stage V sporulation protein K [Pueribacillus sp. YX66]|uniref:stage V sporulation protein K n=1 Tax=Pueribacillus sp. YX66 TaxID=3229242 RepID=UPI00358CE64C